MPKLEYDVSVKDGGLKELTRQINELKNTTSRLIAEFGKESEVAIKAGAQLDRLKNQKAQLLKATNDLSGGVKRSSAQILEMGENITTVSAGIVNALKGFTDFATSTVKGAANLKVLKENFKGTAQDLELFKTATAQTVTEAGLISLSNQASDLGISLKDQSLLFSLAEDAADKYGGSVEDNFQKVVFATEGNIKGLKALGIQKEVYNQTVKDLVQAHGGEVEALQGVNGEIELNIKKLDPATQKQIRLEAILKLTGTTLETVKNKTLDSKDKIEALSVKVDDAKMKFGDWVEGGVEPVITSLLKLNTSTVIAVGGISQLGGSITALLPALAGLKIAFGTGFVVSLGVWGGAIAGLAAQLFNLKIAFEQVSLAFTGRFRETIGGKLYGLDQTNSEENSKNEIGFVEGLMNGYKKIKSLANTLSQTIVPETKIPKFLGGNTGRGGKSEVKEITEDIIEQSKAVKVLANDFNRLATSAIRYSNEAITTKRSPADKNKRAIGVYEVQPETDYQNAADKVTSILDIVKQTTDLLNIGADTFVGKLINGFNSVLSIADSVISLLMKFGAIGANVGSGGIFGIIGSIFGFAEGGLYSGYGTGQSDSNLIRVSNGEYIVNAESTSKYLPLLQAINNRDGMYNNRGMYANGGVVNSGMGVNVYLAGAMDGQKFFRVNEKEFRKFQNATLLK